MQSLCLRAFRCFGRCFVPGMRYLNNLRIMSCGGFLPDLSHFSSSVRAVGLTAHAVHCLTTWQRERHCREHPSQAEIWVSTMQVVLFRRRRSHDQWPGRTAADDGVMGTKPRPHVAVVVHIDVVVAFGQPAPLEKFDMAVFKEHVLAA